MFRKLSSLASNAPKSTSRIVYLNGRYIPESEAKVSVFDRGFLFADAVYEVTSVVEGRLLDFEGHQRRLRRSLGELKMPVPTRTNFLEIYRELLERNALNEGVVYLQITRGDSGDRNFVVEESSDQAASSSSASILEPTVLLFTQPKRLMDNPLAERGLRVITVADERWKRRDIKTTQLLSQAVAKMEAQAAGVDEAWMVEEDGGLVTEGTSSNAFIVKGNKIITRNLSSDILHGITRSTVLRLARESGSFEIDESPFSLRDSKNADEAFMTSATFFALPVVEVDGTKIGDGRPGPVTQFLRRIYIEEMLKTAI